MCNKKIVYLTFVVLLLGLVGSASSVEENWWSGEGKDDMWDTAKNWWNGTVPTADELAFLDVAEDTTLIDSSVTGVCDGLRVGEWNWNCYLDITGGSLNIDYDMYISTLHHAEGYGQGIVTMSGGTVNIGGNLLVCVDGWWGLFEMTGGTTNVAGTLWVPAGSAGVEASAYGELHLYGGTLTAGDLDSNDLGGGRYINITNGTLILDGNEVSKVQGYVDDDWVKAYGGLSTVAIDYNSVTNKTWVTAVILPEWDDGDAGDSDWDSPNNWNPDAVPTANDTPLIGMPSHHCYVNNGVTAECNSLIVGEFNADTNSCYIDVNGGTLNVSDTFYIGYYLETENGGGIGRLDMSSGDVNVGGDMHVGFDGHGLMYMTGGNVTVDGELRVPAGKDGGGWNDDAEGRLYLYGGTIECGYFVLNWRATNVVEMDIMDPGKLIVDADLYANFISWIEMLQLESYDGNSAVVIDYDEATDKTTVTSAGNDWWTDDDVGNSNWNDADNWNDGVPNSTEYAVINIDTTCLIDTGMTAECNNLMLSDINSNAVMDIDGGTLTIAEDMTIGRTWDSNGTVDMDGGTVSVEDLTVGYHGNALFDIAAGTLDINDTLEIGNYGFMELTSTGAVKLTGDQRAEVIALVEDFKLGSTGGRIRFDYNETNAGETTAVGKITTDHNWNNDAAGDSNWSNLNNWVEDDVPNEVDTVYINIADSNCLISTGTDAICDGLQVGKDTATCYLDMTGGTLKVSPYTVPRNVVIGNRPAGAGVVSISGGTVTIEADMLVGYNGTGTLNVSGGTLNIDGKLFVPAGVGTGTLNLSGGTINVGEDIANAGLEVKADGSGTINITAGTLVINGDATARIKEYMAKGYLTAYDGRGRIVYDYNITNSGKTTITAVAENGIAYSPDPAAGATSDTNSPTLSWVAGNWAADVNGHHVYIGSSFDDVNDANTSSSEYEGEVDTNSYSPSGLEWGQKYYWRIDEVNDSNGNSPWKGNVWCFDVNDPDYTRIKINFNQDWKFYKGAVAGDAANSVSYDDYTWEDVAVPHNPKQTNLWENDPVCYEGYSWYRKHFTLPNAYNGKKIFIEFEGANVTADIWVNGTYMTTHYGGFLPFTVDITSVANYGTTENVIAAKLDNYDDSNTPGATSWSLFGGIYRDVWVHVTDKLHVTDAVDANTVAGGGIFLTFSDVNSSTATIDVNTHVENEYASSKTTKVKTYILDPNGDTVDSNTSSEQVIAASGTYTFTQSFTITDPCLWTPETPYLYTILTQVYEGSNHIDSVDTTMGIKTVSFEDVNGFKINGVSRKFRGANRTQDWPYIGMAMSNLGQKIEAIKMKKAGHDYVRTAHYAQDPAFLNACDEYGIMVMDSIPTSAHYWGGATFENRSYQQQKDMIRRDRNHASIITWELSLNETWFTDTYAANSVAIGHTEYPGSYISAWKNDDVYDVFITTPHREPGRDYSGAAALIISEYGHFGFGGAASTSDVYRSDGEAAMLQQVSNHKQDHNLNRAVSDLCGDGLWVWRDYGSGWPSGSTDRVGLPKFSYYFYQSQRDPNVASVSDANLGPMVYIASYWKSDSPDDVTVFSNCDQVKLYINDVNQGIRNPDGGVNDVNVLHPPFTFTGLSYSAGELKAEGLIGGLVKATHVVNTPANASKLSIDFDTEGQTILANGEDMFFVHASVLDANDVLVPTASNSITFTVAGPAVTASPTVRDAAAGIASVLVRTLTEPGTITVTAAASGLSSGSDTVTTIAAPTKTAWEKALPDPPGKATDPDPANSATGISTDANLGWTAGSGTTSHDVYFGTDPTPDETEFKGNQTDTTYNPSGLMDANTTYYWRIDEKNAGGTTEGDVWSFTTGLGVIDVADGETTIEGTVTSGDYTDTHGSDDTYEAIEEEADTSGPPSGRTSYLEHKWTIDVTGGGSGVVFFVEAYHTANSENDDFDFAYSPNDVNYYDMLTVTKTSDDNNTQSFRLPNALSGTVYIRVMDTDRTGGNSSKDTIYVDHMYIVSEE